MNDVVFKGDRITGAQLEQRIEPWRRRLSQTQEAAVAWNNSPELVALIHAAARAGTPVALLNARLKPAELETLRAGRPWVDALPDGPPRIAAPDAVHTLLFTSGTTGVPKAVQHTLANHEANARAAIEVLGIDASSRFLCVLPMFHVGGLSIAVRCALTGATMLLHDRFDAEAVAADLMHATHASLVATTLRRVLDVRQKFPPVTVLVGGGPVPAPLLARASDAGLRVLQTYGLTEAGSMVTCERSVDGSTAGTPMPGMQVRIVEGEIEIRGPALMRGYRGYPPLEGWFRTGDLGELDAQGRLIVHARRTDLIVSGGENVYPAEIETVLLGHPGVREVAVVPAPDEQWGQVGVAYVTGAATEPELRAFLRERLAAFKVPARFVFVQSLPRLDSGKLDRRALYAPG